MSKDETNDLLLTRGAALLVIQAELKCSVEEAVKVLGEFLQDHPEAIVTIEPQEEGRLAYHAGVRRGHNPYRGYKEHEHLADEWDKGWDEAKRNEIHR